MMKKYLFLALGLGFALLAINAFMMAKPTPKAPIYSKLKSHSPYYMEKYIGGLRIRDKTNPEFKEKPKSSELFHRLEAFEKEWGEKHLKIEKQNLVVFDNNGTQVASFALSTKIDIDFVNSFYGVK